MDVASLLLLPIGLSLDDFALAFALSLAYAARGARDRFVHAAMMAVAFSVSTALLPLAGWFVGVAILGWIHQVGAWLVLAVFCAVGAWIIKEGLEDKPGGWEGKNIGSFWTLLAMGTLGSIDEGIVGLGYPFLSTPVVCIIVSVIVVNTILVFLAALASTWRSRLDARVAPVLSGSILIVLGVWQWLELLF